MTDSQLKKSLLSCPVGTIKEHIEYIGMTPKELANRLGSSIQELNALIKGKAPINNETATKLEDILDISVSFWLNLERTYQEELLTLAMMNKSLL